MPSLSAVMALVKKLPHLSTGLPGIVLVVVHVWESVLPSVLPCRTVLKLQPIFPKAKKMWDLLVSFTTGMHESRGKHVKPAVILSLHRPRWNTWTRETHFRKTFLPSVITASSCLTIPPGVEEVPIG